MTTAVRLSNYINGRWQDSAAAEFGDVINPATGETLARVPLGGGGDVEAAVEAAAAAFPEWRRTPPRRSRSRAVSPRATPGASSRSRW